LASWFQLFVELQQLKLTYWSNNYHYTIQISIHDRFIIICIFQNRFFIFHWMATTLWLSSFLFVYLFQSTFMSFIHLLFQSLEQYLTWIRFFNNCSLYRFHCLYVIVKGVDLFLVHSIPSSWQRNYLLSFKF
jgi:hypothetical protein